MIRHDLHVWTNRKKQRRKDRAFNQSKRMIGHRDYRALLGNQRQVAIGDLRVDVQQRERMIGNQPVVGAGNIFPKAIETIQPQQFFDRTFHRLGQLLTEQRGNSVPHSQT